MKSAPRSIACSISHASKSRRDAGSAGGRVLNSQHQMCFPSAFNFQLSTFNSFVHSPLRRALRFSFLACLIALAVALPASAQKDKPLPKGLPPFGPEKPLQTPRVQQTKLENGLTVWLVSGPGVPKVSFDVVILGGYAADPKERPGLSDLLAATIDQGTKSRNARQIAEQLQDAGGDLNAVASRDAFSVSAAVLSSKSAGALAVLAD